MLRDVFYYTKKPNVHPREKFAKSLEHARQQSTTEHFWIINEYCDYRNFDWDFDFEFLPDEEVWTKDHNNIWPSQHQKDSGTWLCPKEYSDVRIYRNDVIKRKPSLDNWKILDEVDTTSFDFSWHPDPSDPPFIYKWGTKFYPPEIYSVLEYHTPNANMVKYMPHVVELIPSNCFVQHVEIDKSKFDFSWRPHPHDPPYIYVFGNQHNSAEIEPTIEYHVPGATDRKYITDIIAYTTSNTERWKILIPVENFDFTWRPNPHDPPYIYVWGNQHNSAEIEPTIEYHASGATDRKYMGNVEVLPEWDKYKILIPVDKSKFDFSWRPNPHDPPYIYVFGNQHNSAEIEPTIEYHVPGAVDRKYITDIIAYTTSNTERWKILIPVENFDFSWRPNPHDPPYIYVFGNQWYDVSLEPTLEYHVPGAVDRKYITDIIAYTKPNYEYWTTKYNIENFDYSWRPHPHDPPMIYQFGTLLDDIHLEDGPVYAAPNNNGTIVYLENKILTNSKIEYPKYYIKTTLEDLVKEHNDEIFWALNSNINYDSFDFSWRPNKENVFHINVFGSPESETTQTYFVNTKMIANGYMQKNYLENKKIDDEYLSSLFKPIDMFYVDRGNKEANHRYEKLKLKFPNIQKTRYLNTWVDTINRCLNKCNTELCWILNSELDYSNFNFDFYPNPWQMKMVHVFGTQWSHWGTTFVVNKDSFAEDTKYIKIIEHLSNINFVKKTKAVATNCLHEVYIIDHGNSEAETVYNTIRNRLNSDNVYRIEYQKNYLNTFKNLLEEVPIRKDHYIWVCSSICDYDYFDFSYIVDPFAKDQLHVFASDNQKFGDTFLVDVNKLRTLISDMKLLEDYEKINFNQHQKVSRLPCPVIINDTDTHAAGVKSYEFDFPYALLKTYDNTNINLNTIEPINLWSEKSKAITLLSEGGTNIFVPKDIQQYEIHELYDYPYINKVTKLAKSNPMDIVFLSNGESIADENYDYLLSVTKHLPNRVIRVDGINGRVNAYHAAAKASNTPWLFTVFAKLKINKDFDFNWQPDRLQLPKHYIFYATNPVNGLEYGHQAMIAYNKNLALNNNGIGLDFTLDDLHEVLPLNSGSALYNTDEFSTWRTAFREAIKLRADNTVISQERLEVWRNVANGKFAEYSIMGANDAVNYYEEVNGDLVKLKLSYEWDWLKERFDRDNTKRNNK